MKRFLIGFGLGLAGIALALGLTLGALAVAGPDIGARRRRPRSTPGSERPPRP